MPSALAPMFVNNMVYNGHFAVSLLGCAALLVLSMQDGIASMLNG